MTLHPRRAASGGFSMTELLIALALFAFVALAAYTAFDVSNKVYRAGESATEMQQRTRLAHDLIMEELRLAGFDHNRDGEETVWPDHPDEQIEYVHEHAIGFRGNLDYNDGSTGREPDLEYGPANADFGEVCCPIVTTANDEIIVFALRSDDATANQDSITLRVDTSAPRDAGWDISGDLVGEETVTIENVDLSGDNPPYTVFRFHVDADGAVVERAVAPAVRTMNFEYEGADSNDYYCSAPAADGTCASSDQRPFDTLGGNDHHGTDDFERRDGRAAIRRIHFELVGMTEEDDPRFVDEDDTVLPHRRKLALRGTVAPPNLGRRGRPDIDDEGVPAPLNVTVCGGQCNTVRIEWEEVHQAASYQVDLFLEGATEPFFSGFTPGVLVEGSDPPRVYATYQRLDAPEIVDGATLFATVRGRSSGQQSSPPSDPSDLLTLTDVVRLEAPRDLVGSGYDATQTGWPDVVGYDLLPDTAGDGATPAEANQITISWLAPQWTLNVLDPQDPAGSWTTRAESDTYPALDCDHEELDFDDDGNVDLERTWQKEMIGDIRYFVFRSTNPRFVPTEADLVGSILGQVDVVSGRVFFTDESVHHFANQTFTGTDSALENCRTYYYRVRAVDDCYTGGDPASTTDPTLSPFFPRLNPDETVDDSDDVSGLAPEGVGLAIPGFAAPRARPKAPREVRFTNYDFDEADGDGVDATIAFDAVKLDMEVIDDGFGQQQVTIENITVTEYHVFSHATDPEFPLRDGVLGQNGARLDKVIVLHDEFAGRIAHDDENGDGDITAAEDESIAPADPGGSPASGLRIPADANGSRWYRVAAVQCAAENTVPSADEPEAFDYGRLSAAMRFPCEFGGGPYSVIEIVSEDFPVSVTATAFVQDLSVPAEFARLVLTDPATGDRAITAPPGKPVPASGIVVFDDSDIVPLTDNFGNGDYRVSVEMTDINDCVGSSDAEDRTTSLPSCCMEPGAPFGQMVQTRRARLDFSESCGTLPLRIHTITLQVDNANEGQPERFRDVWWGDEHIWSGSKRVVVIDRSDNPLILPVFADQSMYADFNRTARGDNIIVTFEYNVAGQDGSCTFSQEPL